MHRLLLVHGDLVAGELLARKIEQCGHVVERVPTLRAAAAIAQERYFDLAIVAAASSGLAEFRRECPAIAIMTIGGAPEAGVRVVAALAHPFTASDLCGKLNIVLTTSVSQKAGA